MDITSYSQAALALASGRSTCVALGLMNAGARKKSSPRLVGIVGAFLALSGVRAIIVARFDATLHLIGCGGCKTGYAPIEPGEMVAGGFFIVFVWPFGVPRSRVFLLGAPVPWVGGRQCGVFWDSKTTSLS